MLALAFNICLALLPLAGAAAFLIVHRDGLYAYEYSEAGARVVRQRLERLNGELIQLDFDRKMQWEDLVAMELMAGDVAAARGFLLSVPGMLPGGIANPVRTAGNDADRELAALELLSPGTRARYEATVPLLSRRAASGAAQPIDPDAAVTLGDERDFELLARTMLSDSRADTVQFVLTGFTLGLAGDITPEMKRGAATLLAASRREDYPAALSDEVDRLVGAALPLSAFRSAAQAGGGDAGAYANAAAAFRHSVNATGAAALKTTLADLGQMSEAASLAGAAALLTHANSLSEMSRLKLVAQAGGDRAAAAAKRLPRDGRLLAAARGQLTMTRDLFAALALAGAAALGLIALLGFVLFQMGRRIWLRLRDDEYGGELVDISTNNWSPL